MIRLILSVILLASHPVFAEEIVNKISVAGVGEIVTTPDIATVRMGVTSQSDTARKAMDKSSKVIAEILNLLEAQGVGATDIQTSDLSLFPEFENRTPGKPPTTTGFRAQNLLSVTVRDLPNLGRILDLAGKAGGNVIQSIQFEKDDTKALMDEARKKAIENAIEKATLYATSAGVNVGPVITISEQTQHGTPLPIGMARAEAMVSAVPMAGGELTVRANVFVEFLIE